MEAGGAKDALKKVSDKDRPQQPYPISVTTADRAAH
jgi:hypothetical protein